MPTSDFSLAEAAPSYTGTFGNERTTSARSSHTLKSWRSAMQAGGWTEYFGVYAAASVTLNVAHLPVRTPDPAGGEADKLPGAVICTQQPAIVVTFPGGEVHKVWGYDPGQYREPPCASFPYGWTTEETFEIFKPVLAGAAGMGISSVVRTGDVADIRLVSIFPGADDNGITIGGWTGGTVWHGGYNLRSGTYRGHFLSVSAAEGPGRPGIPSHSAMELQARVHQGEEDLFGRTPQRFSLWMDPAQSSPFRWRICVCPYQFAIWMDGYGDGYQMPSPQATMVSMPWAPEGFTGHACFAFVITSFIANIRQSLAWHGFSWFDGGPWSRQTFQSIIVPALRTRADRVTPPAVPDRITTTQGLLITDNAYVTARRDPDSLAVIDNRVAGKLWNCCTVSDNYPPSTVYSTMSGGTWVHVSSENWHPDYAAAPFMRGVQKASVWWRVDSGLPDSGHDASGTALRAADSGDLIPPEA